MRYWIRRIVACGAVVATAIAGAPAAAQSEPASEWEYREDPESCRASRTFGIGDERILLQLRSYGPGSAIEVTVASPVLPRQPFSARLVELGWDGEEWELYQNGVLGMSGGIPTVTVLVAHRANSATFKGISEKYLYVVSKLDPFAQTMRLRVLGSAPVALRTGSFELPLAHLALCESALMAKWGWGQDYSQRIASVPEMRNAESFDAVIWYPGAQLIKRISGILQLRLKIDAGGKVAECVVQSSPGSSLFGSETCKTIRRQIRYTPARDHQGQAVDSYTQLSISFARHD